MSHWRRQWHPTPVFLLGKSHGQRSLVGCSPWGRSESGTTKQLHFHFSLSGIEEGNGNPLQFSCLENPRDRGAQWAAVYEVAQSRTQLKRLSSSSSSSSYMMCLPTSKSNSLIHQYQLGVQEFNSTLTTQRQPRPYRLKGTVPQDCPEDTRLSGCLPG